jgi:hypothetical protein
LETGISSFTVIIFKSLLGHDDNNDMQTEIVSLIEASLIIFIGGCINFFCHENKIIELGLKGCKSGFKLNYLN